MLQIFTTIGSRGASHGTHPRSITTLPMKRIQMVPVFTNIVSRSTFSGIYRRSFSTGCGLFLPITNYYRQVKTYEIGFNKRYFYSGFTNKKGELLIEAVINNNVDGVEHFLETVDVNYADNNGHTALTHAVACNNFQILNILLKKNADINSKSIYGNTPLIIAILNNNMEIVEFLLKNGADISIENVEGLTALDIAMSNYYTKKFVCLLKKYMKEQKKM